MDKNEALQFAHRCGEVMRELLAERDTARARCAVLEGLLREAYSCVYYARNKQTEKAPYDNLIARIDAALGKDKP